jgi:excisionase family DNA binding protein
MYMRPTSWPSLDPELLVVREVADLLRISPGTIVKYAKKGIIPGKKVGTVWRFQRAEIEKLIPGKAPRA